MYPLFMAPAITFGEWLDDQLRQRGWTQSAFADLAGVGRTTVNSWVNDVKPPRRRAARDIASALEVDINEVLVRAGYPPADPGYRLPEDRPSEPEPARVSETVGPERTPSTGLDTARIVEELRAAVRDEMARGFSDAEVVTVEREESAVAFYGWVPADGMRWIEAVESGATEMVWDRFLGGRSPRDCLCVRARGDCLMSRGIMDTNMVLLERSDGREPRNGQIVLVRRGDDRSLKIWQRDNDHIELRDGEGRVADRFSTAAEHDVIGLYITHWPMP